MLTIAVWLALAAPETRSFDALTAEAKANHTPLVVDVFTTWCKPCAMLEKTVFANPKVVEALSKARFVRYDAERGAGVEVAERFAINSYPTILVLTADGTVVGQLTPSPSPEAFIASVAPLLVLASVEGPFTDEALAKKDVDPRALYVAGLKAMRASPPNPAKAAAWFDQASAKDSDNRAGVKSRAITEAARVRYAQGLRALQVKALLELVQGDPASPATVDALGMLSQFAGSYDPAAAKAAAERLRGALAASKNANQLNLLVYSQLALLDTDGALATAKVLEALNPDPNTLDTVAEAYFQANQKERAIAIEEAALKAMSNAGLRANLQRFKTEEPAPPPFGGSNPLADFAPASRGPGMTFFAAQQAAGAQLTDACRTLSGKARSAWVRLTFTGEKVTKAVAFDVETPAPIRQCLQSKALGLVSHELSEHSPVELEVRFDAQL